jgi:hypothetical protein
MEGRDRSNDVGINYDVRLLPDAPNNSHPSKSPMTKLSIARSFHLVKVSILPAPQHRHFCSVLDQTVLQSRGFAQL